jgi:hypothetical protein
MLDVIISLLISVWISGKVWFNALKEYWSRIYLTELKCDDEKLYLMIGSRWVYLDLYDHNASMIQRELFDWCSSDYGGAIFDWMARLHFIELFANDKGAFTTINGYTVRLNLSKARMLEGIRIGNQYFTNLESEKPITLPEVIQSEGIGGSDEQD